MYLLSIQLFVKNQIIHIFKIAFSFPCSKNHPPNPKYPKNYIVNQLYRLENSGIGYTPADFHESHK